MVSLISAQWLVVIKSESVLRGAFVVLAKVLPLFWVCSLMQF